MFKLNLGLIERRKIVYQNCEPVGIEILITCIVHSHSISPSIPSDE